MGAPNVSQYACVGGTHHVGAENSSGDPWDKRALRRLVSSNGHSLDGLASYQKAKKSWASRVGVSKLV